jgi:hypothetical protein
VSGRGHSAVLSPSGPPADASGRGTRTVCVDKIGAHTLGLECGTLPVELIEQRRCKCKSTSPKVARSGGMVAGTKIEQPASHHPSSLLHPSCRALLGVQPDRPSDLLCPDAGGSAGVGAGVRWLVGCWYIVGGVVGRGGGGAVESWASSLGCMLVG